MKLIFQELYFSQWLIGGLLDSNNDYWSEPDEMQRKVPAARQFQLTTSPNMDTIVFKRWSRNRATFTWNFQTPCFQSFKSNWFIFEFPITPFLNTMTLLEHHSSWQPPLMYSIIDLRSFFFEQQLIFVLHMFMLG